MIKRQKILMFYYGFQEIYFSEFIADNVGYAV